jgi:hypothetical protein
MTPHCVFCGKKTDKMIEYYYHGVELDERKFPIPVHRFCYLKKKTIIWSGVAFSFLFILFGFMIIESLFFYSTGNLFNVPLWLIVINCFFGLVAAGYSGIRLFSKFEHLIVVYKRSHTDYEDYYKSDRRRRAGFKNW